MPRTGLKDEKGLEHRPEQSGPGAFMKWNVQALSTNRNPSATRSSNLAPVNAARDLASRKRSSGISNVAFTEPTFPYSHKTIKRSWRSRRMARWVAARKRTDSFRMLRLRPARLTPTHANGTLAGVRALIEAIHPFIHGACCS